MVAYVSVCQSIDYVRVNGEKVRTPRTLEQALQVVSEWNPDTYLGVFGTPKQCAECIVIHQVSDFESIPSAPWGWGVFKVRDDGSLEIVSDNYDSSG